MSENNSPAVPTKFVKGYVNAVTYQEPDGEHGFKTVTNTRRKVRRPGTEGHAPSTPSDWEIQFESVEKRAYTLVAGATTIPDWVVAILNTPRGAANEPHTSSASSSASSAAGRSLPSTWKAPVLRLATPGSPNGTFRGTGHRLRQQSIIPYLRPSSYIARRNMLSPGRHVSNPIVIDDHVVCADRTYTRMDGYDGTISFQAGSVKFVLEAGMDPTRITVVQYPSPKAEFEVQCGRAKNQIGFDQLAASGSPNKKRKFDQLATGEGDVFTDSRLVEQNTAGSSSTSQQAVFTCSGRKKRRISTLSSTPSSPGMPPSSPELAPSPSPTPSPLTSSASKGKGRLN